MFGPTHIPVSPTEDFMYLAPEDSGKTLTKLCYCQTCTFVPYMFLWGQGNSTVVSISVYQAGDPGSRPPIDPLVLEKWNCITVLLTRSRQCRRLVQKRPSMCYYVCVIMHVKDP